MEKDGKQTEITDQPLGLILRADPNHMRWLFKQQSNKHLKNVKTQPT